MGWITAVANVGAMLIVETGFLGGGFLLGAACSPRRWQRCEPLVDKRAVLLAMTSVAGVSLLANKVSILITPQVLVQYGASLFFGTQNVNVDVPESGDWVSACALGVIAGSGVLLGYMFERNLKNSVLPR